MIALKHHIPNPQHLCIVDKKSDLFVLNEKDQELESLSTYF
jgi:hypothetical protein